MNPCAQESKTQNGRFLREKLISHHGLFSYHEGQQGEVNRQDLCGVFRDMQGFGRLDAGSCAGFTTSRPPLPWTSVFQIYYFCINDVWP